MPPKIEGDLTAPVTKAFTVADRRTVHGEDGPVAPGDTIDLSPAEGKRLQRLGFLLNDDGDVLLDEKAGPVVVQGADIKER